MDLLQTHPIGCPYCGETIHVVIDCSVPDQEYIEDCQVCCRPINFNVAVFDDDIQISASHENE